MVLPYNKLLMACLTVVPGGCDYPPYNCSTEVDPSCVENFNSVTSSLIFLGEAFTLAGYYSNATYPISFNTYQQELETLERTLIDTPISITGTTILSEANVAYTYNLVSGTKWDVQIRIERDSSGEVSVVSIRYYNPIFYPAMTGDELYGVGDVITIPGSSVGGVNVTDDLVITFVSGSVAEYNLGAWESCTGIGTFPLLDVSNGRDFSFAWNAAIDNFSDFPLVNTSNGENFTGAWYGCRFNTFPLINVGAGITFNRAWERCYFNSGEFPLLNTANGRDFIRAWERTDILTFPALDMNKGINFNSAWRECYSMTEFSNVGVSSGSYFNSTWKDCYNLINFPALDMNKGLDFTSAWEGCFSMETFGEVGLTSGIYFNRAWLACALLFDFPVVDMPNGIGFSMTWNDCSNISAFPSINISNGQDFTSAWEGCTNLSDFPASMFDSCTATNFQNAWLNCSLSQTSVNNILISLDTAGQSNGVVNLNGGSNSPPGATGITARNNLIAKGWTVTVNS